MKTINASKYDEIISKLNDKVRYYNNGLEGNRFTLNLANGDYINLTFPENFIAHILGVNIDSMRAAGIVRPNTPAYEVLRRLINSDITYRSMQVANPNFNIANIFSDYIDEKLDIFIDVLKIRTDDIYCIIKYLPERAYATGEDKENSEYFIIRKHGRRFSALGIIKNDNSSYYVPVTSRLFADYNELGKFLAQISKNQEVTYPYFLTITNVGSGYHAKIAVSLEDKLGFNNNLKDMAKKYNAIPATYSEFPIILDKLLERRNQDSNYAYVLNSLRYSAISGELFNKDSIRDKFKDEIIPEELEQLIDTFNDNICNTSSNETVQNSISSIQNENVSLKEELEKAKAELLKYKEQVEILECKNSELASELDSSDQKLKVLTDAFESIK